MDDERVDCAAATSNAADGVDELGGVEDAILEQAWTYPIHARMVVRWHEWRVTSLSDTAEPSSGAYEAAGAEESLAVQADDLCSTYNDAVAANGPLGIPGFDPDDPDPAQLPLVTEHFAPVLDAAEDLHDQLAELDGGTAEEQPLLDELVEALGAENANARAQADAASQSDVEGFTANGSCG